MCDDSTEVDGAYSATPPALQARMRGRPTRLTDPYSRVSNITKRHISFWVPQPGMTGVETDVVS